MPNELMTVPRFLLYAKACYDVFTTKKFVDSVLLPLVAHSVIKTGDIQVLAQTSFSNMRLDPKPGPFKTAYQRFDIKKLGNIAHLAKPEFERDSSNDMATQTELETYLLWASGRVQLGPCDTLNLWGHGSASSVLHRFPIDLIGWRNALGSNMRRKAFLALVKVGLLEGNLLQPKELATALRNGGHQPGLIALTACRVSSLEFAYDLRDSGTYLIASTTKVEEDEWPYSEWFTAAEKMRQDCGLEFAGHLLAAKNTKYPNAKRALIRLNKIAVCQKAIDEFIGWMISHGDKSDWEVVLDARKPLKEELSAPGDTIAVDLGAFFSGIVTDSRLKTAAKSIVTTLVSNLNAAVAAKTWDSNQSKDVGISLIFPQTHSDFLGINAVVNERYNIKNLPNAGSTYIQQSRWLEFLHAFWASRYP